MAKPKKLSPAQIAALRAMPALDGYCDGRTMRSLAFAGLITRGDMGNSSVWWRITDAGRRALEALSLEDQLKASLWAVEAAAEIERIFSKVQA